MPKAFDSSYRPLRHALSKGKSPLTPLEGFAHIQILFILLLLSLTSSPPID